MELCIQFFITSRITILSNMSLYSAAVNEHIFIHLTSGYNEESRIPLPYVKKHDAENPRVFWNNDFFCLGTHVDFLLIGVTVL